MLTITVLAILLAAAAGIMNGSFAIPTKHVGRWNFENIWLNYALWAFVIIPWAIVIIIDPDVFKIYQLAPPYSMFILYVGGFLFGVGQVCFALALRFIGFGLGFSVNLALGTALGFLLPMLFIHPEALFKPIGLVTSVATILIVLGLLLLYLAGKRRDQLKQDASKKVDKLYIAGIFLALFAGLFSAGQNFSFALTTNLHHLALLTGVHPLVSTIVIWPPFLTAAFIPYAAYMLYLHTQENSFKNYRNCFMRYSFFAFIMGVLWFGSLIAYSKSAILLGSLGPVIAWPLFMVLIILTAVFWGWRYGEWLGTDRKTKRILLLALVALIAAVITLGYTAQLPI